jgi:hypothetical protein
MHSWVVAEPWTCVTPDHEVSFPPVALGSTVCKTITYTAVADDSFNDEVTAGPKAIQGCWSWKVQWT